MERPERVCFFRLQPRGPATFRTTSEAGALFLLHLLVLLFRKCRHHATRRHCCCAMIWAVAVPFWGEGEVEGPKVNDNPQGGAATNAERLQDEALSRQPRIRRMGEIPSFVRDEVGVSRAYRHRLEFSFKGHKAHLRYRRSRWSRLEGEVPNRMFFCWIALKRRRVAALQLFEFEPAPWLSNDDFLFSMDVLSDIDSALAEALCSAWDRFCDQVTGYYGNLVDFRMAWADPACRAGLWAAAAKELIAHELPDYSLLTMKAYPLEYEGRVPAGSAAQTGLEFRQLAMIRYYQRLFGVQKFPGQAGNEGWLYRINPTKEDAIERPRKSDS
jgi:hypothetical protein